ncbi:MULTISPECIES: CNP1-like family protein [unclassified Polynucleobacter]|uniref:CNP1-like family protein n=1 Tax=unclassified Polynucleobacter TaxID=2640945 RepID=UPI00257357B0|nr:MULTISPECIES: CNP1-like family protein [unclassified Polynucleobacter]
MNKLQFLLLASSVTVLSACFSDPLADGTDPFAPTVFKEGETPMPLNPPNKKYLIPFSVSQTTIFKFAVDTESIKIGNDGVTRYIVVITNPSGGQNAYFEGIRCDTFQWRLYGTLEANQQWRANPLGSWLAIKDNVPNRYQAALAQGAFCNLATQEKSYAKVVKSLDPNNFLGITAPVGSEAELPTLR